MQFDKEDSIYNKSFFDIKDSLPQLSTLMSDQFEENQNTENGMNQSQFDRSLSGSSRKLSRLHNSEQNLKEQITERQRQQQNELLKYIVKSVQKYVSDLQISQRQNCRISSIQISQQKRIINKSPQFGAKCSMIQISDIKKSIIQNLFTIKEDIKQDQDEMIHSHEKNASLENELYISRKQKDNGSSNQLQGLSSIGDKQSNLYENYENIEVEQFDIKSKTKVKSPQKHKHQYQQQIQTNKQNPKSQKIKKNQQIVSPSPSQNKSKSKQDLNNSFKNESMKKSIESIIMDEEFINMIVPEFSINKIEHHRFPSFSNDLRTKFIQFQKEKINKQRLQRIKNNFSSVVDEGLKLKFHQNKKIALNNNAFKKRENNDNENFNNKKVMEESDIKRNDYYVCGGLQLQKQQKSVQINKNISYHKLNYSRKTTKQRGFSSIKKIQNQIIKQNILNVQNQVKQPYKSKDNYNYQISLSLQRNGKKQQIKHNHKGISLMKKTLCH